MQNPTPSMYQEALQFPETAFPDPDLQEGQTYRTSLGLPQAITGAYAVVFPVTTPSGKVAVRCFLSDIPSHRARYRTLSRHLPDIKLPYFVPFEYRNEGIIVAGRSYPLVKMEWIDGVPLNRFIEEHLEQPEVLTRLADVWLDLAHNLEQSSVAHGDLQHGNVLVVKESASDGSFKDVHLKLVDYDTIYLPSLHGKNPLESGHRNYQHPDRTAEQYGPHIDRFSVLVMYTGIRMCISRPELWQEYDTGENIVFSARDFFAPESSELFNTLEQTDEASELVRHLKEACYLEPEQIPSVREIIEGRATAVRAPGRKRLNRARRSAAIKGVDAVFLSVLTVIISGIAWMGWMGMWSMVVISSVVVSAACGFFLYHRWKQHPATRRYRRLMYEISWMDRIINGLQDQLGGLNKQLMLLENDGESIYGRRLEELRDRLLYDRLKYHFISELEHVDGLNHKVVVQMKVATIRTAYHATPQRVAALKKLSDDTKARINMWRAALVSQYRATLPDSLPSAEERRLKRTVKKRMGELEQEKLRLHDKIRVQQKERDRIVEQLGTIPEMSFTGYVRYIFRLGAMPDGSHARNG